MEIYELTSGYPQYQGLFNQHRLRQFHRSKIVLIVKNKKNINKTINRHRYEVHGIPYPDQQQQQQQPSKKQKISRGAGGCTIIGFIR